jgi:hypothetical protein
MEEQRQYKRFPSKLPVTLEAMTTSRLRILNVETRDISATGAFIYTNEAAFIPDDTRFILNSSNSDERRFVLTDQSNYLFNCLLNSKNKGVVNARAASI